MPVIKNVFETLRPKSEVKPLIIRGKGDTLNIKGRLVVSLKPNKSAPIGELKSDLGDTISRELIHIRMERATKLKGNRIGRYVSRKGGYKS